MLPDYKNIPLQKLLVCWTSDKLFENESKIIFSNNEMFLSVIYENFEPKPLFISIDNYEVIILGNPIINNIIDKHLCVKELLKHKFSSNKISEIDGEFLFIFFNRENLSIKVINDRFSSIPVYYYHDNNQFIASFAYNDLWNYLNKLKKIQICQDSFYEMIHFRRIFDDKTYDKLSKFLTPSSHLTFINNNLNIIKYWEPNFNTLKISLNRASILLADYIKKSILKKTSDKKKTGLFLSGGFDTRTILAGFSDPPVCFTASYNKKGNREFEVAQKLCQLKNSSHYHLQFTDNHFTNILKKAVFQVGGMHQANSVFMGYRDFIKDKCEVLFHGHGFDYMFQGMYLPSSHLKIFNHNFQYKFLNSVPENVVDFFIKNAPYRVKYPFINNFIHKSHIDNLKNNLNNNLNELFNYVKNKTHNRFKQLEYLTFHALTRHYSYSDHAGIHTNTEQRTISFDNDIYNFFLKLPIKYRFDRLVLRKTLKILDKRFFTIYHANTNLPLGSSLYQTFFELKKKILKALKIIPRDKPQETHLQRTWPTHEWIIRNELEINFIAKSIIPGCSLEKIEFLDLKSLQEEINKWLNNGNDYPYSKEMGDFVWSLITLKIFLDQ